MSQGNYTNSWDAASGDMQRAFKGFGAPADKITVRPFGANARLFTGAAPSDSPPTVLLGRLSTKKGPLDAIGALQPHGVMCY